MSGQGGVTQYLAALRPHLPDAVQYFTVGRRSDTESAATTLFRMLEDSWRFARTLRKGNFEIVHINPSIFPKSLVRDGILLLIAKALKKEVLVFAHGWNPAWERNPPRYVQMLFRYVYAQADALLVLGEHFKQRACLLGYRKRIFVERAPVSDDLLDCGEAEWTNESKSPDSLFNILFLARVEKDKGIYEALDTYFIVKQKHPFVTLTVAGSGAELNAAREYATARRLEDVVFLGHVAGAERRKAFRMASAYLFPSHHEGLPLSVLEAMAFGIPIVTCEVGGLRDFFENGRMGFITRERSPEMLASLLDRLISDRSLCAEIRGFNRNYARMHFTARQIATGIQRIYLLLLGVTD